MTEQLTREMEPHEGQQEVLESDAQTRVVSAGRRWGKTTMALWDALEYAEDNPNSICWYLTFNEPATRDAYERAEDLARGMGVEIIAATANRFSLVLENGSQIEFPRLSSFNALPRDANADYVALDDVHLHTDKMADIRGVFNRAESDDEPVDRKLIVGTSKPRDEDDEPRWFEKFWRQGSSPQHPSTESWMFTSTNSPFVDGSFVDDTREKLSTKSFRSEYLGEFVVEDHSGKNND